MGRRHSAREYTLKVLYQIDVCNKDIEDGIRDSRRLINHRGADMDYFLRLIYGIMEHLNVIDNVIQDVASHWSLERIDKVDKNILRLALFELLYCDDIPRNVSIDEAVELGKLYGTEDSGTFINGILDTAAKKLSGRYTSESSGSSSKAVTT